MKKLTPMAIHDQEFKHRGLKGYDRHEVDSFLDRVVDDYGDALDEEVDLKNKVISLRKQVEQLQSQVTDYENRDKQIQELQQNAQNEANAIIDRAHKQEQANTSFEKQQQEVIKKDYDRLKQEVAEFRNGIQKLLQNQIDVLNDDKWQHALDKYFHTDRFYPFDGSEPIMLVDDDEDDEDIDEDLDDDEDIDAADIDNADQDDVNFDEDNPDIMTGDSPNQETMNVKQNSADDSDTTIVFPNDYKDHN